MSYMLEFPPVPLPPGLNAPPYIVFGIYGTDMTSALPPRIPLSLVLHFAPALKKWVLPAPDPAYLPTSVARHALRTSCIGIDILAPIDVVGLCWIVTRMLHLGGDRSAKETFSVQPDLTTSLAIHDAWLKLELPVEGIRNLHTHIHAQLLLGSSAISLWDMRILWEAFPHNSDIVRAMGLNFVQAHMDSEYHPHESLEIQTWFRSSPELYMFFLSLQTTMPEHRMEEDVTMPSAAEKDQSVGVGYQTVGKKAGKAIKAAVAAQADRQVGIMEKETTRKVTPQERHAREHSDFEALKMRLRRTRSDESLRSVDTAIWNPQAPEEDRRADVESVGEYVDDSNNYVGGSISDALARSLETIRLRREVRLAKNKSLVQPPREELTSAGVVQHSAEVLPALITERLRYRRPTSSTTNEKEKSLSVADLESRIQDLKAKQEKLTQATYDGDRETQKGENIGLTPAREWRPGFVKWTGLDDDDALQEE